MLKKSCFFLCLLFCLAGKTVGQFYNQGQEASGAMWMQAKGERFTIIYPFCAKNEALRFSNFLNAAIDSNAKVVRSPITVVVHPWNPRSNGFVAIAPRRMELYSIPPQDQYPQEWLSQLALHEYRHVIQMDRLNQRLVRTGSFVLGEQGWGLAAALVPRWYLEGDAVLAETQFSKSGRGRLPSFDQGHRTAILSGKGYSYDKWLMGSYKDYIPNHYELGYKLVTYGEMKYGVNLWNSIMDYTARKPYALVPFYFGLKRYAGVSRKELFDETFRFCDSVWQQSPECVIYEGQILSGEMEEGYYDEKSPTFTTDSTLVFYRTGLKQGPRLVTTNLMGTQSVLYKPNYIFDPISGNRNIIVWNEYLPSHRWGQQGISRVKILDVAAKREQTVKCDLQLFSPDINRLETQIIAVGVERDGKQNLCFFDIVRGKEVLRHAFPCNVSLQNPKWVNGGDSLITYTKVDSLGKSLCLFNVFSKREIILIDRSKIDLANPISWREYVIFKSYNSQVNNLFAIDTASKRLYRLTASLYGSAAPAVSPSGKYLAFERYTPAGSRVSIALLDTCKFIEVRGNLGYNHPFERYLASKSSVASIDTSAKASLVIGKYKKGLHLFRIHSWAPFFYDPFQINVTSAEFKPGFSLISQNTLSTTMGVMGVSMKGSRPNYHARLIYQGWFPVLNISADYGAQTIVYRDGAAKYVQTTKMDRLDVTGSISFPVNLTYNRILQSVVPSVSINHTNDYFYYRSDSSYSRNYELVTYRVVYYGHLPSAPCDVRPPWGTLIDLRFRHSPFENENTGSVISAQLKQMTPGFFANHSLMLTLNFQKQQVKKYYMSSAVAFPRGYLQFSTEQLFTVSGDYAFPLVYPDMAIPNFVYLKRIRANAFYDFGKDSWLVYNKTKKQRESRWEYIYSYGLDIGFDYHLFRNAFPISTTIRFGNTRSNEPFFNVFFGLSFNN